MYRLDRDKEKLRVLEAHASSTPGVLLLTSSLNTVAYNWEAAQILAFPNSPERLERLPAFFAGRIRSKLASRSSFESQRFVREFKSGSRTYQCHALELQPAEMGTGMGQTTILLFERQPSAALSLKRRTWKEFGLTQRERQTVELLLQGMTTKQIAQSMNVSPNTIKSYLRFIMTKMKVTTRAGIIGKILTA